MRKAETSTLHSPQVSRIHGSIKLLHLPDSRNGHLLELKSREITACRETRSGGGICKRYSTRNVVQIRDVKETFKSEREAIDWFKGATGLTSFGLCVKNYNYPKRRRGERSFALDALRNAQLRREEQVAAEQARSVAITNANMPGTQNTIDPNANIQIRRHSFSSPEARFLVAELDKSLAEFYPDWDQLVHPNMHHENNPHPPDEEIAEHAAREASEGGGEVKLEDQEMKDGLVFWVAFDTVTTDAENSKGKPIACAALRLFSPQNPLPSELDPALRYAELKRMFVLPSYQGRGISKLLLAEVEQYALRTLKLAAIVIETGLRQKASLRLYEGAGYQTRSMFGQYVGAAPESGGDSTCLEKRLK